MRVVSDLLFEQGVEHHAVQMTAGQNLVKKGRYVNVGKTLLLETLSLLFATGDLTFAHDLPLRGDILAELETFQLETTAAGNQVITQGKSGAHHGGSCHRARRGLLRVRASDSGLRRGWSDRQLVLTQSAGQRKGFRRAPLWT